MDSSYHSDDFQVLNESWVDLTPHLFDASGNLLLSCDHPLRDGKVEQLDKLSTDSSSSIEVLQQQTPSFGSRNASPLSDMYAQQEEDGDTNTTPHFLDNHPELITNEDEILDEVDDRNWVLGWSSQPINQPPGPGQFRHPRVGRRCYSVLSLRKTEAMRRGLSNAHILYIVLPSFIISNFIAFGIGFYLGRNSSSSCCKHVT